MFGSKVMRSIFYCWIFCYILNNARAEEHFQISLNKSTWFETAKRCSLAVPRLNYGSLLVDIQVEQEPEELWIGYYTTSTTFEYIACMPTRGYEVAYNSQSNSSPGRCRSVCRYSRYFGISRNNCYCIYNEPIVNQLNSTCYETCGPYVCGSGNHYMSTYREIGAPAELPSSPVACLSYDPLNNRPVWSRCDDYKRVACRCNTKDILLKGRFSWSFAIQNCQRNKCFIVSNPNALHTSIGHDPVWTSITIGNVIHEVSLLDTIEELAGMLEGVLFGFLFKDSMGYIWLRFGASSQKRRAICIESNDQKNEDTGDEHDDNIVGLIVGVSVPGVLITIVIVVGCIILRKRRMINKNTRNSLPSNEVHYNNTALSSTNKSIAFVNITCHGTESETSDQDLHTKESEDSKHTNGQENEALSGCYDDHTYHIPEEQGDRPNNSKYKASPVAEAMKMCDNEYAYAIPEEGGNSSYKAHLGNLHKKVAVRDGNTAAADDDDGNDYHSYAVLEEHECISGVIKNGDQNDQLNGSYEVIKTEDLAKNTYERNQINKHGSDILNVTKLESEHSYFVLEQHNLDHCKKTVNGGKNVDYMKDVSEYNSKVHTQKRKERNLNNARHKQLNEEHTNAYNVLDIRPRRASDTDTTYNKLGGDVNVMNHVDKGIYNVLDLEDDVYNHTTTVQDNPASTPKDTYDTFANIEKRFDKTLSQF